MLFLLAIFIPKNLLSVEAQLNSLKLIETSKKKEFRSFFNPNFGQIK